MLAKSGGPGIAMVEKRFRGSAKRDELRRILAEVLGQCGDEKALDALLRMVHDKTPEVAAAAAQGCGAYAKVKPEKRKAAMRELVDRFRKVADEAAGKGEETREAKMYQRLRDPMNATLKAMSGGEELDSPQAWDAWLRENATRPWPE
jgi:HEAT repeat protein